ncbi:MAG: CoA transferase [Chloroflexi bacterium]|nr:CoA transferase [Chloroflexota bacterium]
MADALEGIRVIDFSWVLAGPAMARYLGDFGAQVIKVESNIHPDVIRTSPPYHEGKPGINRSTYWANYNCNKYSMNINLDHPKGPELAKRLIAHADAVVENFIPGTMDRWGLGYQDIVKVKPDIIMVSISLFGQKGPYQRRFGFGTFAEGMSGLLNLFGWADRGPSYFQTVVGDALVPFLGVSTLLAALEQRDRTGQGQWIDLNQLDVCSYLMSPLLLDYAINGREASRCGNSSPGSCPHAVYPCSGVEKWCAISVCSDEDWRNLYIVMGEPDWWHDPRFATFASRKANEVELDQRIGAWTVQFAPEELMRLLQKAGVPAGAVLTGKGIFDDPQLRHRDSVWYIDHPDAGEVGCYTVPFKLSATPPQPRLPAPRLGEHTEYICTQLLNMSTEEFVQLFNEGVLV